MRLSFATLFRMPRLREIKNPPLPGAGQAHAMQVVAEAHIVLQSKGERVAEIGAKL